MLSLSKLLALALFATYPAALAAPAQSARADVAITPEVQNEIAEIVSALEPFVASLNQASEREVLIDPSVVERDEASSTSLLDPTLESILDEVLQLLKGIL